MAIYDSFVFGRVAQEMRSRGTVAEQVVDFLVALSLTDHKEFAERASRILKSAHRIESTASVYGYGERLLSLGEDAKAFLREAQALIDDVAGSRSDESVAREAGSFRPGD